MAQEWSRRLADLTELRLADMDANGVDVQVLSLSTPGLEVIDDPAEAVAAARRVNDYLAKAVAEHSTRFAGLAALPLQDPQAAVVELRRAVEELGSRVCCTTIMCEAGTWTSRSSGRYGQNSSASG